jgi:hypothetical protein
MQGIHLEPCDHCGQAARLELKGEEALWRVRCPCGLLTAWSPEVGPAVYVWNRRQPNGELLALREEFAQLAALHASQNPPPPREPLGASRLLTTSLPEPLVIRARARGSFNCRSGDRWENRLDVQEAMYVAVSWLFGRPIGYLRTQAQHEHFWASIKMPPDLEDYDQS